MEQSNRIIDQSHHHHRPSTYDGPTISTSTSIPWTFTQGFLVGQISVVIVIIVLVRYVIFEDSKTALDKESQSRISRTSRARQRYLNSISRKSKNQNQTSTTNTSPNPQAQNTSSTLASILSKTGYDLSTHSSESLDWLNVVFAQAVAGYRDDVLAGGVGLGNQDEEEEEEAMTGGLREKKKRERSARALMEEILNKRTGGKKMDFLDPISVTEVDFGDQYPILTNARVRPADDTGRMRIEVDLDYSDSITMAIDTKLVINFPKPRFAVLPISLGLTVHRFSGILAIELCSTSLSSVLPTTSTSTSTSKKSRHELHFSLHPDFSLDATATSLLGSRAKLQDVPKIEQLLVGRLRSWVHDRFVWPRFWSLSLPNLVPSPGATSPKESKEGADGEMGVGRGNEFDMNRRDGNVLPPGASTPNSKTFNSKSYGSPTNIPPEQIARVLANRALNGEGSLFDNQTSMESGNPSEDWNRTLKAQNPNQRPSFSQGYSSGFNPNSRNGGEATLPGAMPAGNEGIKAWRDRSDRVMLGNEEVEGIRQRRWK